MINAGLILYIVAPMYLAIIIFVVIVLLGIVVAINFADSDVPNSVRLVVSSIIIIILAAGVYYLTSPLSTVTSTSVESATDSLLNRDTLVKQKENSVKKTIEQADNTPKKNTQPPTIKAIEPANAGDARIGQTKNTQDQTDPKTTI